MARQAIENALKGQPDVTRDPRIQAHMKTLLNEAHVTLSAIRDLAGDSVEDPFIDPGTLARAVTSGILDAPHLKNNPFASGKIETRIVDGACQAVDADGHPISEEQRIGAFSKEY
jgi:hypothetical protein